MRFNLKNKEGKINKKLAIPLAILVVIGLGVTIYAISAYFASLHAIATTGEPIFISTDNGVNYIPLTSNIQLPTQSALIFPGETAPLAVIYINNAANVSEPIYLSMNNTNNTVDGNNWVTTINGSFLDGSPFMVSPGISQIVVTTTYNGAVPGAELDTIIYIGGTLQGNGTTINPPTNTTNSTNSTSNATLFDLGEASNFVLLSESGITATGLLPNAIVGNVGTVPITGAALTGFDHTNVNGIIYTVDAAGPSGSIPNPALLTSAVDDMHTAYNTAFGLPITPGDLNVGSGNIGGMTLTPGIYRWNSDVTIFPSLTLDAQGNSSAVFVFQITGNLNVIGRNSNHDTSHINLINGADAHNVYWVVAGTTSIGNAVPFSGNILTATNVVMNTDATLNGRVLAQTAITLAGSNIIVH